MPRNLKQKSSVLLRFDILNNYTEWENTYDIAQKFTTVCGARCTLPHSQGSGNGAYPFICIALTQYP
jgi:hypothetical protein